ncbi:hypothetical protein OAL34_03300 [Synechococcus sp. AH-551-G03]|nr:hypothetical protein [Synechococcus sp. AH-551-G03]
MTELRWKPLKSSVNKARFLTGLAETVNRIILTISVLISMGIAITAIGSENGSLFLLVIPVLVFAGIIYYLIKLFYIALELLTEIADDTRLQLLSRSEFNDSDTSSQDGNMDENLNL